MCSLILLSVVVLSKALIVRINFELILTFAHIHLSLPNIVIRRIHSIIKVIVQTLIHRLIRLRITAASQISLIVKLYITTIQLLLLNLKFLQLIILFHYFLPIFLKHLELSLLVILSFVSEAVT